MGKGTSSSIGAATPSLRAVRQGESILSLNGSPLAVDPMQGRAHVYASKRL
jgi:hypothetical protein